MTRLLKRFFVSTPLMPRHDRSSREDLMTVLLTPEETHYAKHVMRLKKGSSCLLFDASGNEFVSRLGDVRTDKRCEAELVERIERTDGTADRTLVLSVAQAIPQHRKMDVIIQKAAELGVFEIIPLVTERTVVHIPEERKGKVLDRWQRIAEQTLQQSRLKALPNTWPPTTFSDLLERFKDFDAVCVLHPSRESRPIREVVGTSRRCLLLIGPEGGFSDQEVEQASARGAKNVRMNTGILKTDTAFVASVGALLAS
jgi:16S rRNA (uracil1498-N3)-methyltransferase